MRDPGKKPSFTDAWRNVKVFVSYYGPYKKLAVADLISILTQSGLTILLPMVVYRVFNDYLPRMELRNLLIAAALLFLLTAMISGAEYVSLRWGHILGARMEADMRKDLFSHIQKLSFNYFDRTKTGHIMSRISNDLTMLAETAHHAPEDLLISTLTLTGAFIVMFSINPLLAAITLIPLPFIIVWGSIFQTRMRRGFRSVREKIAEINRSVENSIQGVREVKSFTNEGMEIVKFKKVNTSFLSAKEAVYSTLASFHAGEKFLMQSYSLLFIGAGALLAYYEKADFPQIIAFFMYSRYITMPMMRALSFTEQFQQASSAFERFQEVMLENPDLKDAPDAVSPDRIRGTIRFRDVSFSYPSRPDADVINHVSFEVKAGTTIALVGESGAGKSTIAALIPRFYDVSEGSIEIDGIDVRKYRQRDLRSQIGIVQQSPFLFDATIRENILFGRPGASEADVLEAAREANVLDFVSALPDGLDTQTGERGVKLSGGQRQRISIARVFLKNPPILIFDEATSALDNESEELVRQSMETLCKGRTAIIIAHRLSTVKHVDLIYCLKNGTLIESGTHAELIAKNGYYKKLYDMHSF